MTKKIIFIIGFIIIFFFGIGIFKKKENISFQKEEIVVQIENIKLQENLVKLSFHGVCNKPSITYTTSRHSKIDYIIDQKTSFVKANTILIIYNSTELIHKKQELLIEKQFISEKLKQIKELIELKSPLELHQIETEYKLVEIKIRNLEEEIKNNTIRAPWDSVIKHHNISEGEVPYGREILTIFKNNESYVEFLLRKNDLENIKLGIKALFLVDKEVFEGKLVCLPKYMEQNTVLAKTLFQKPIPQGQKGKLILELDKKEKYALLNSNSILRDVNQQEYVYVIKNSRGKDYAFLQKVRTGDTEEKTKRKVFGLVEGQKVAVSHLNELQDSMYLGDLK